jgi:hypothetical protein
MAYIFKNAQGKVIAASITENLGHGWLFVEDNAKEYLEFLDSSLAKNAPFRESDIQLARVLEDLISILIERNLIQFTDFPAAAQKRLNDRQNMRENMDLSGLVGEKN